MVAEILLIPTRDGKYKCRVSYGNTTLYTNALSCRVAALVHADGLIPRLQNKSENPYETTE